MSFWINKLYFLSLNDLLNSRFRNNFCPEAKEIHYNYTGHLVYGLVVMISISMAPKSGCVHGIKKMNNEILQIRFVIRYLNYQHNGRFHSREITFKIQHI